MTTSPDFEQCATSEIQRAGLFRIGAGKLADSAKPSTVAIRRLYSAFLVPVKINGISTTLVLDTGATQTLIMPEAAARAGLEVTSGAPMVRSNVVGGRRLAVPLVSAPRSTASSAPLSCTTSSSPSTGKT
jgi:predicted aspartyl protease